MLMQIQIQICANIKISSKHLPAQQKFCGVLQMERVVGKTFQRRK